MEERKKQGKVICGHYLHFFWQWPQINLQNGWRLPI
ncbi:hypothetical protein RUMGNA_01906 [Mediterraneibacter gnavus ATCC 29149]|uniref:Uncharacterized protein n=1 Tax=Mediterraneibacter gnavus (strain ATCC 29149 / DSM 114966 / JCM 6515 / VPI C7-9) TaxID=411470 RepID=A7B2X8_MEDG7|nr:hypothetical protein RUMGNA_01906 [Mediterraneibacter gnavus ATCC 29149]